MNHHFPTTVHRSYLAPLAIATLMLNVVLGIHPQADRMTWALENSPVWLGLPALWMTRQRFPLTNICYALLTIHAVILMIGGYYTYAQVPSFNWLRDTFHLTRNYYDRLGHFAQGFVPAMVIREVLLRKSIVKPGGWLFFLCVCVCLAGSALFELWEWRVAVGAGAASTDYLGSQGDIWDAQWDMACALIGSVTALLLLSRAQDHELSRMGSKVSHDLFPSPAEKQL